MRIGLFLLVLLTFALPLHAGERKSQPYQDSIIELRTEWAWTKPQRGTYWVNWNDGFTVQKFQAYWSLGGLPRIEVRVERLAPQRRWLGRTEENYRLDDAFLKWWYYLIDSGVGDIVPIQCEARECVTFTARGIYDCGAFVNWSGQLNVGNDTDLISGYYCAGRSIPVTTEILNKILASLHIR